MVGIFLNTYNFKNKSVRDSWKPSNKTLLHYKIFTRHF